MDRSEAGQRGYEKTRQQLKAHRAKQSQEAQQRYVENPKYCAECGQLFPYEKRYNKFCNQSCAASYNNRGVTRHSKGSKVCACGKPKKTQNQYCAECIEKRVYNHRVYDLKDANNDKIRKRILLENRPHQCEVCGLSEWRNQPIPLEMDHIDGNADHNEEENLRLICPNCHAQTETYKGANAGRNSSRQKMRRKRYAKGQTY
jgi:predicted Zn-ribbon and HTH transcriptional regulator